MTGSRPGDVRGRGFPVVPYLRATVTSSPLLSPAGVLNALSGYRPFPAVDPTATALENAVAFFDSLDWQARAAFGRSVVEALQSVRVTSQDAEIVYCLLQLVAYCKPLGATDVLQKLLATRELRSVAAMGDALEALAVRVYSEYTVTPWLGDYLRRRLAERSGLIIALAALEVLAIPAQSDVATALAALCDARPTEKDAERVRRSLFIAVRRCGMSHVNALLTGPERAAVIAAAEAPRQFVFSQLSRVIDRLPDLDPGHLALRATVAVYLDEPLETPVRRAIDAPPAPAAGTAELLATLPQVSEDLGRKMSVMLVARTYHEMLDGRPSDGGGVTVVHRGRAFHLSTSRDVALGDPAVMSRTEEHAVHDGLLALLADDPTAAPPPAPAYRGASVFPA